MSNVFSKETSTFLQNWSGPDGYLVLPPTAIFLLNVSGLSFLLNVIGGENFEKMQFDRPLQLDTEEHVM